jgi:hypothetical protein
MALAIQEPSSRFKGEADLEPIVCLSHGDTPGYLRGCTETWQKGGNATKGLRSGTKGPEGATRGGVNYTLRLMIRSMYFIRSVSTRT